MARVLVARSAPAIPRSRTGKKLELPVKRILLGADPDEVASRDSLIDPTSLDLFVHSPHVTGDDA